jgi:hypothetical protein
LGGFHFAGRRFLPEAFPGFLSLAAPGVTKWRFGLGNQFFGLNPPRFHVRRDGAGVVVGSVHNLGFKSVLLSHDGAQLLGDGVEGCLFGGHRVNVGHNGTQMGALGFDFGVGFCPVGSVTSRRSGERGFGSGCLLGTQRVRLLRVDGWGGMGERFTNPLRMNRPRFDAASF